MEKNPRSDTPTTLMLSVYIITFLIGVPTNILAFYTFSRKVFRKSTPIDILLLNLTVSDLLFLAFLPAKMKEAADDMTWNMPYFVCSLSIFLFFAPIYTSILFLTAISVERYVCVAYPTKYKAKRRISYTVVISVSFWVVSVAQGTVVYCAAFYGANHMNRGNTSQLPLVAGGQTCYGNFTDEQLRILLPVRLNSLVTFFSIPLLICCFCYINFIWTLSRLPHVGQRRKLRAIGLALGSLLVFALCFAPFNVSHVMGFIKGESPKWRIEATMLSTLNACLDPIIFYCSSWEVRKALRRWLKGLKGSQASLSSK
ncbi:free fatty acid receptor 3-like [Chanos chanos]|uniref:Free fatty acid receptor 3-like n=1 Tax=Chanos chanos TaxID=29144 RepID=A0A6J2WJ91_CHACN|nr:free fatty acid receptor 3-like [Chanos chanos]